MLTSRVHRRMEHIVSMPAPGAPAPAAPTDPAATPPAAPAPTPQPPATPPAPPAQPQPNDPAQPPATDPANDDTSPWNDPVKAKAEIERLRRERGDERIEAKRNAAEEAKRELLSTLTVALGGNPDAQTPPTVESLTEQVGTVTGERDAARTEAAHAKRSAAIVRAAVAAGVNPARLDYVEFLLSKQDTISGASPDDAAFGGTLTAAITQAIANDPSLKMPGASVGTGGPGFSGTGAAGQMTKSEFDALPYAKRADLYRTNRAEYDRLVNS
ncbi:scaffolding protein [Microbacterium phage Pickles13]|nr:scaffolding protein [Microbacterium phage Pickles13]